MPNHAMPNSDEPGEHYSLPGFMEAVFETALLRVTAGQTVIHSSNSCSSPVPFTCILSPLFLRPPLLFRRRRLLLHSLFLDLTFPSPLY